MTVAIQEQQRSRKACPECGAALSPLVGPGSCASCGATYSGIAPQAGPQYAFLIQRDVDIVGYGGAAGGGKTWALLLDPLKDMHVPGFGGVLFRREATQITNEGGLWDSSLEVYPYTDAEPRKTPVHQWIWSNGNRIVFTHLQRDTDIYAHQGGQYCWLGFDELTHFGEAQFWYLLSRNRSTCGVRPRCRATFNPDASSWVKLMFAPWVDDEYPDRAEFGEVRYLVRIGAKEGTAAEYHYFRGVPGARRFAQETHHISAQQAVHSVHSVTFIEADLQDNPALQERDPSYLARLLAQDYVEQRRLLYKDWNVLPSRFFREWLPKRADGTPWHVVPTGEVPKGLRYYLGVDWGFSAPWACYLMVLDYAGRVTLARELYATEVKTSDQGQKMIALIEANGLELEEVPVYAAHDTFNRRLTSAGTYDEPIVLTWQRQGLQCIQAGRDPQARAHKYREYLADWGPDEGWPDGRPGLQVMECCTNFIRTFPLLEADEKRPEIVDTKGEDHGYDGAGHVLTALPERPDRPPPPPDHREKRNVLEDEEDREPEPVLRRALDDTAI